MASSERSRSDSRPTTNGRHPTAPTVMTMNSHFANVGEAGTKEQYEHGIQVIDEDQNFKYVIAIPRSAPSSLVVLVTIFRPTWPLKGSHKPVSITT